MRETGDLFKKIRDTRGTFHVKMGTMKNRSGMDLTETEDTKKWQECTEELYKKSLFFFLRSQASLFKNKVMSDVRIKVKSITELHLPSNQFPQTPCPHTHCVPNSFLSE